MKIRTLERDGANFLTRGLASLRRRFNVPDVARLAADDPDLIHAHFGPDALEAAPIARAFEVPLLVTLHGYDINVRREWWESGEGGRAMRRYPQRLLELSARENVSFVAVSGAVRDRAVDFGIPASKIHIKYIGVDTSSFTRGSVPVDRRRRQVLFVGRLVEKKGCEILLRAMQLVRRQVPDAEVVVIGDGPLRSALENLSQALDVHATFKGVCGSPEVIRALDEARVFCLPSITASNGDAEGLPIVLLEAQAKGVPVVTSANGGATEGMVHGQTGLAFKEGDVDALSEALVTLLRDDEQSINMADAAPRFIGEKFDIKVCTASLEMLYDNLMPA